MGAGVIKHVGFKLGAHLALFKIPLPGSAQLGVAGSQGPSSSFCWLKHPEDAASPTANKLANRERCIVESLIC